MGVKRNLEAHSTLHKYINHSNTETFKSKVGTNFTSFKFRELKILFGSKLLEKKKEKKKDWSYHTSRATIKPIKARVTDMTRYGQFFDKSYTEGCLVQMTGQLRILSNLFSFFPAHPSSTCRRMLADNQSDINIIVCTPNKHTRTSCILLGV